MKESVIKNSVNVNLEENLEIEELEQRLEMLVLPISWGQVGNGCDDHYCDNFCDDHNICHKDR